MSTKRCFDAQERIRLVHARPETEPEWADQKRLTALLLHVARQGPAWEVTGLADILRDEGMPADADELLAARTASRRPARGSGVR